MKKLCLYALVIAVIMLGACNRNSIEEQSTDDPPTVQSGTSVEVHTYITETTREKRPINPSNVIENSVLGIEVGNTSPEELLRKLKELHITLIKGKDGNERIYHDIDFDRMYFYYRSEGLTFEYDRNEMLQRIEVRDPSITTTKGIRVGDGFDKLIAIHGEPNRIMGADEAFYYTNGKWFLEFVSDWVFPVHGIKLWSIWAKEPIFWEESY